MKGLFILLRHQGVHNCCCICHEWWRRINYFCSGSRNEYKQNKVPNFPQFPARVFIFIQHTKLQNYYDLKQLFFTKERTFLQGVKCHNSSLVSPASAQLQQQPWPRPSPARPSHLFCNLLSLLAAANIGTTASPQLQLNSNRKILYIYRFRSNKGRKNIFLNFICCESYPAFPI